MLRFNRDGTFVDVFADNAGTSIDNVRGIDFRGTDLFVVYDGVAPNEGITVVDALGANLGLIITDASLWDVEVLPDNRFVVVDDGSNTVSLYEADGLTFTDLLIPGLSFPEQLDSHESPGPCSGFDPVRRECRELGGPFPKGVAPRFRGKASLLPGSGVTFFGVPRTGARAAGGGDAGLPVRLRSHRTDDLRW